MSGIPSSNPAMKTKGGGMGTIAGMRSMLPTRAGAANFMGGGLTETLGHFGTAAKGGNIWGAIKGYFSGSWAGSNVWSGASQKASTAHYRSLSKVGLTPTGGFGAFEDRLTRNLVKSGRGSRALNRGIAGGGAALGLGIGISAITGYSVFNQAQAVGGGYLGAAWAKRLGAGKLGMGAAAVGAGLGGQAMDWKQWGAASAGYWGVRAGQSLLGRESGAFLGKMGKGGGIGRAAGMGLGLGLEYLVSNVL